MIVSLLIAIATPCTLNLLFQPGAVEEIIENGTAARQIMVAPNAQGTEQTTRLKVAEVLVKNLILTAQVVILIKYLYTGGITPTREMAMVGCVQDLFMEEAVTALLQRSFLRVE
jgi:hypothetical protein